MMTDDPDDTDDLELRRWREDGKAPAGSCPYCASRISMVERDGFFRARCSHRGCGATGPKMRSITRAADLFCCPPQRTAAGMTGERALREHKRRADLDSRLGDALRASGINAADALAVQALYATAGQSGSHRIVSALRAIEAWIREGGAL